MHRLYIQARSDTYRTVGALEHGVGQATLNAGLDLHR